MENVIFQSGKAKGYDISIGRVGQRKSDFILRDIGMGYAYVQAAMTIMADRRTEDREYKP